MTESICRQPDCQQPVKTRGWCAMHYRRWQRHGDPTVVIRPRVLALADARGDITEQGCWLAADRFVSKTGYAYVGGSLVHRRSYQENVGPIPPGLHVDHTCHNRDTDCAGGASCLHRRCFNPEHLEAVTPRTNTLRSHSSTAGAHVRKTHCPAGHPYSDENTYRYGSSRHCRTCLLGRYVPSQRTDRTHCANGHEYTDDNTYRPPTGGRQCRTCSRANVAAYKARKAEARLLADAAVSA